MNETEAFITQLCGTKFQLLALFTVSIGKVRGFQNLPKKKYAARGMCFHYDNDTASEK